MKSAKYEIIANDIRNKIRRNHFKKDQPLPNQDELTKKYNTSRVTIQRALNILKIEGLIYTKIGVGTFVQRDYDPFYIEGLKYGGFTDNYSRIGNVNSKIISYDVRSPEEAEKKLLELKDNQMVHDIVRVRYLDGEPLVLEYTIMPVSIIPGLNKEILENSIYSYITNELGLKLGSATRNFTADKSDAYDHKYLECDIHDPVLEVEQVVFLDNGKPFEYSQVRYPYNKGAVTVTNII